MMRRQDGNRRTTGDFQRREPWRAEPGGAAAWLGSNEIIPVDGVDRATREADAKGIDHCIKDGIDQALPEPSSEEDNVRSWDRVGASGDDTADVENELGGIPRQPRGAGDWGRGSPLRIARKGIFRDLVDGGGLCSPGRWPKQRRTSRGTTLQRCCNPSSSKRFWTQRRASQAAASRRFCIRSSPATSSAAPFSNELLEPQVRTDLRLTLKRFGFGDGLPQEGD